MQFELQCTVERILNFFLPRFNAKQIEVNMNIILLLEIVNRSIEEEDAGEGPIKATIDKQHNWM